MDPKLSQLSP